MALGTIPNDVRVPLVYIEIDNSQALSGNIAQDQNVLLFGQMITTGADAGTATPNTVVEIPVSESAIDALFGQGSLMALAAKRYRKANSYTRTFAIASADLAAGAAATGSFIFGGPATQAGTVYLLIAGQSVQVGVIAADTAASIATKAVAAINANKNLPVTAAVDGTDTARVNVTAKWKGLTGNDIDLRYNYYAGEQLPPGVTMTFTGMATGSGAPDMAALIAAMPDEWYNHIMTPFNDTASLNTLRDELLTRWGPLKMAEAIAYTAFRGTYGETITFGEARNDFLLSCMGTSKSPSPSWEFAASYCGVASYQLAIDPARPLQTLALPGILAPAKADRFAFDERNNLLKSGIATYQVQPGDVVAIEREVSMYQKNAFGDPDPSYLDITTPATLGKMRYDIKVMVTNRFPRHKLADDNVLAQIDPAQPVVTPKLMEQAILEVALDWVTAGLMENFDLFKETLSVYRDTADRNRLNCVCHPDVVNQLRVFAALIQFKL
ncbi:TPA: phage tail sheath subtilisin-like domain-containing protein [Aeromonas veronii]|uniref:phage tail sheath subtilisin-like domain-containing protein n=1 Tax=Aeromonas veronii TaxID=654 RepID=UPI00330B2E87|nr:phage tail sheath subtilisin-like domain-containing protein [Aeromonas veronii]HDO1339079.1 phage tail sheath subtilisin-like domain-containing protein [Aeromonas veronii]HDO1341222.1 phage tail sheath subtilisin-like domain-containing protein [Aeromonas veronii]HDO1345796.1 phage tail sheath subtilisin-like domain-containing protein [Aeromonas veronii]HDO1351180.1 phage tail sheath subtilisin-like domain-containing protein [Aeromonas veronii]